jgi:hypothetical protein
MRHWIIAGALAAGLFSSGLAPTADAASTKPLLSGMRNENDADVQHIRDAMMAFWGIKKRWPATIAELDLFADQYPLPHNLTVFEKVNYYTKTEGSAEVAVFEFVMKGSPTKGAFALVNYVVK